MDVIHEGILHSVRAERSSRLHSGVRNGGKDFQVGRHKVCNAVHMPATVFPRVLTNKVRHRIRKNHCVRNIALSSSRTNAIAFQPVFGVRETLCDVRRCLLTCKPADSSSPAPPPPPPPPLRSCCRSFSISSLSSRITFSLTSSLHFTEFWMLFARCAYLVAWSMVLRFVGARTRFSDVRTLLTRILIL